MTCTPGSQLTKKRDDNEQVVSFVQSRHLPESLAKDIKRFYDSHRAGMQIDVDLLYDHMSLYLRVEVAKHMGRELLDSVQMMSGCSPNFLDMLAVLLRQVRAPMLLLKRWWSVSVFGVRRCAAGGPLGTTKALAKEAAKPTETNGFQFKTGRH